MLALIVLLIIFYTTHSLFAATFFKEKIKKLFPSFFSFYRLAYSLFSAAFFGFIVWWFCAKHEHIYLWDNNISWMKPAALFAIASGIILISASIVKYSFTEFTGLDVFLKTTTKSKKPALVVSGLNAWVRHPIYTGVLFTLLGLLLMLPTLMTLSAVLISLLYLEIGIRLEEQKLIAEFGEPYLAYRKKVKKIIPFIY